MQRVLAMRSLLLALCIAACAGSPPVVRTPTSAAPERLQVRTDEQAVTAYRYSILIEIDRDGDDAEVGDEGLVFLEPNRRGQLALVPEEGEAEVRPLPVDEHATAMLYFPTLTGSIGPEGREQLYRIAAISPAPVGDLVVRETLHADRLADGLIRVRFDRHGYFDGDESGEPSFVQHGAGSFDPAEHRYRSVTLTTDVDFAGSSATWSARLELDRPATHARGERRAQARQALAEGAASYDEYVREHTAHYELGEIELGLQHGEDVSALAAFHARAHAAELWRLLFALEPGPSRSSLLGALTRDLDIAEPLPDQVVELIGAHVDDRDIAEIVVELADERFRGALRTIARSGDRELSAAARDALADFEPVTLDQIASAHDAGTALQLAQRYSAYAGDPRPLLPVLASLVERDDVPWFFAALAGELVESVAYRTLGDDPAEWRAFYDEHRDQPYERWIVDATYQTDRMMRLGALVALRSQDRELARSRAKDLLADVDPVTTYVAADTLAALGDRGGQNRLIDLLDDPWAQVRRLSFVSLARVSDVTFGFDPEGDELERSRAIGRWRRWAAE